MNASAPATGTDTRRPVDRYLGNYSEDHRNPTNRLIHWICVPLILWTAVAMIFVIPVPPGLGRPGLWAALASVLALSYYLRLSISLAVGMIIWFAALLALTVWMHAVMGPLPLLWTAIGVFVAAWIAQFVGHHIEGRRPSFLTDLTYLLVGPLWLMSKLYRRVGIGY